MYINSHAHIYTHIYTHKHIPYIPTMLQYLYCVIYEIYFEGKPNKTHLDLYQATTRPCQWAKIGDFTRRTTLSLTRPRTDYITAEI